MSVTWQPGEVILDLYEVVGDPIGEGGMGRVYKVRHRGWNKDLAVKVPLASQFQTEEQKRNFETECETWINLGLHPHIVSCYYVRRVGDVPCVFAEFVEGGSLHDWVRSGRLYDGGPDETLRRILDIAIQFAWGLHYAHEQGLVHQDVKPENVLVTPDGAAKVTDFGVARARAEAVTETTVAGGTMLAGVGGMTPAYCSPEQAQIRAMQEAGLPQDQWPKLTRRTDLWSWAASVFEMLAGGRKWQLGQLAGYAFDEFAQTGLDDARIPAMPAAVAELLKRCFQENPDDRPHDMHAVASELAEVYAAIARAPYPREEPKPVDLQADGLNNRAVSLLDLKKEDEARAAWEQAVARDPGHLPTLFNHGLWRWRRGEIADHDWVRELRAGSGSAEYDRWLGLAEARRANWQEARRHLEQAAKRSPGDGEVWAALGTALYNLGDAREALAALTRASELSPDRWRVWHNLGIVQTSLGVPAVATAARLTALRPDSPELVRGWASAAPSSGGCVRVFAGHRYGVVSVALSPDGRFALSGGDWTLRRWEVATGECVRVWEGQWAKVHSVASSPCGRFALSGSRDGPLHLWEAATGECLRTFEGHTGTVVSAAFSPCGRFALSGSDDQTLRLWEVETGDCVRVFEGHTSGVNSVAFSPCGRFALSGGFDDTLRLWAVATGSCIRILVGHGRFVYSVAFSPCGRFALSGSEDQTLRLWEVETGDCVRVFEGHTDSVNSVAFSPSGWFALSGSQDRTVRLWGVATGDCIRVFEGHGENVFCVAASPCGGSALSGSADGTLRLWDVTGVAGGDASTCRWPCEIEPAEPVSAEQATMTAAQAEEWLAEVRAACERSDGHGVLRAAAALRDLAGYERDARVLEVLVSASEHGILRRSGLRGAWQARVFEGHPGWVNSVAFSPDGRLVLSAGRFDRALRLWGVATGDCLGGLEGHGNGVTSVVFSPCGWFALSGSDDNTLRLWEWTTGDCVRVFDGHTAGVNCVALSPCGRLALSGSDDNTLRLWEVGSGDCICVFEGHGDRVESVAFSPCGRFALSGAGKEDPTIRLWQVATRECLRIFEGHAHGLDSAVFSPCGRFALSGSLDHTLRLWEVLTGECSRVFEGHTHWVESVAFSPCGRFGLSGSDDNALRLWEVATGNCIRVFEGHTRGVHSVAMSPDGGFALSGSHDGALRLWELDWEWEPTTPADWDEDARPYLSNFLCLQQPKGEDLLTPIGPPKWDDADFQRLLKTLGRAGYGWLRPEGVRRELEKMTAEWQGPPPLPGLG